MDLDSTSVSRFFCVMTNELGKHMMANILVTFLVAETKYLASKVKEGFNRDFSS